MAFELVIFDTGCIVMQASLSKSTMKGRKHSYNG